MIRGRDQAHEQPPTDAPEFTPALLNELFRLRNRADGADQPQFLTNELKKRGLSQHQRFVEETFAIVLGAPYVFLDTYPGGAVSSDALWAEHDAEIRRHSPWLDEDNFGWVRYWSQYFRLARRPGARILARQLPAPSVVELVGFVRETVPHQCGEVHASSDA